MAVRIRTSTHKNLSIGNDSNNYYSHVSRK